MTWHENKGHIQVNEDYVSSHQQGPAHAPSLSAILKRRSSRASSAVIQQQRGTSFASRQSVLSTKSGALPAEMSNLEIKFKLPEYLCEFEAPVICQYEADLIEYLDKDPNTETLFLNTRKPTSGRPSHATIEFINALSDRYSVSTLQRPSTISNSLQTSAWQRSSIISLAQNLENFKLNKALTQSNINTIQSCVLPRMLSSYKLPEEIAREKQKELSKEARGVGMKRVKADDTDSNLVTSHIMTHKDQYNPERLFPIFPKVERINLKSIQENVVREPETFLDMINMLEHLRTYLNFGYRKIMTVPAIKIRSPKMRTLLEHLKDGKKSFDASKRRRTLTQTKKSTTSVVRLPSKVIIDDAETQNKFLENKYSHWTTKYILQTEFEKSTNTMKVSTNRLGVFGFAVKRYLHFPFKYWQLSVSEENPDTEIVLTLITQYVKCIIKISAEGFAGYVTEPTKGFVRNRKMYLEINKPLAHIDDLKKAFRERNLNIFTDLDASYYIEKPYYTEKHFATELHTYACMALHCGFIRFEYSNWNCLAARRDILLNFVQVEEIAENKLTVRIKPESTTFVEVKELCSDNLDIINLDFTLTWRNLQHCSDLHQAVNSVYSTANDRRLKDFLLICNLRTLLGQIRLLSYS